MADGRCVKAFGKGSVPVTFKLKEGPVHAVFHDVLFVPSLQVNLFSMSAAAKMGVVAILRDNWCLLKANGIVCGVGYLTRTGHYELRC